MRDADADAATGTVCGRVPAADVARGASAMFLQRHWGITYREARQRRTTRLSARRYGQSMKAKAPGSDPVYKRLLAFPEVVADVLRSLLRKEALRIDEASLRKLPAECVGDDYRQRRGDTVWQVRTRAAEGRRRWLHVLVLLEHQSTDDRTMALRVLEYTVMLYRELRRAPARARWPAAASAAGGAVQRRRAVALDA